MAIQSAINSMLGSASHAVMAVKSYQQLKAKRAAAQQKAKANLAQQAGATSLQTSPQAQAAQQAQQSMQNAVEAKLTQRRSFIEYLKKQPSSLGPIGKLPVEVQKQIAKQYTPSQRQRLMNLADEAKKKGGNDGKHQ